MRHQRSTLTMNYGKVGYGLCMLLMITGIAFMVSSLATIEWMVIRSPFTPEVTVGLWKVCEADTCVIHDDYTRHVIPDDLKDVRGLCISTVVLYGGALFYFMFMGMLGCKVDSLVHAWVCLAICAIATILTIAGVGHFVRTVENDEKLSDLPNYHYGFSLHLAWVSALFALASSVCAIPVLSYFIKNREKDNKDVTRHYSSRRGMFFRSPRKPRGPKRHTIKMSPPPIPMGPPPIPMGPPPMHMSIKRPPMEMVVPQPMAVMPRVMSMKRPPMQVIAPPPMAMLPPSALGMTQPAMMPAPYMMQPLDMTVSTVLGDTAYQHPVMLGSTNPAPVPIGYIHHGKSKKQGRSGKGSKHRR